MIQKENQYEEVLITKQKNTMKKFPHAETWKRGNPVVMELIYKHLKYTINPRFWLTSREMQIIWISFYTIMAF